MVNRTAIAWVCAALALLLVAAPLVIMTYERVGPAAAVALVGLSLARWLLT